MARAPLRILVVEDDPLFVRTLQVQLGSAATKDVAPFELRFCPHAGLALQQLKGAAFDLVLLDLHLGQHEHGLDALPKLRAAAPNTPIVIHSVATDHASIVQAMRRGAFDYLPKQAGLLTLASQLRGLLERWRRQELLQAPAASAAASGRQPVQHRPASMLGTTPAMQALRQQMATALRGQGNVVISGETGAGKELVARGLRRDGEPFVAVDAGTLDAALANSVLFGHERGAFTGAERRSIGLFEQAHGGVLFLDEVANLSLEVQAKLLRVLQEREIWPLGSKAPRVLQFRLVCATHANLPALCRAGRFRADLHMRMEVFSVRVPPLRERRGDIAELFRHFLGQHGDGGPVPSWGPAVERALLDYPFPGNVRELSHAAQVALAQAGDAVRLRAEHLPAAMAPYARGGRSAPTPLAPHPGDARNAGERGAPELKDGQSLNEPANFNDSTALADWPEEAAVEGPAGLPRPLEADTDFYAQVRAFERRTLIRAFAEHRGNISAMARKLGLDRSSLYAKLRLYAIHTPRLPP